MDNINAIWDGGLSGNNKFFGTSTTEVASASGSTGGWNEDFSHSASSIEPWFFRGSASSYNIAPGVFGFADEPGGMRDVNSHRTILSGY